MDVFSAPQLRDDGAARKFLESVLWPEGLVCPHCGVVNHAYATKRPGVFRCAEKECRKDFTVTMRTVMERSKIALHKWLQAFHLMCSSKKGISAHQLHRTLGVTYEAAWFMAHRIREAMREGGLKPLGGEGKVVEADETYYGDIPEAKRRKLKTTGKPMSGDTRGPGKKRAIVSLVERGGEVRSFHVPAAHLGNVVNVVRNNIARESRLHTDESPPLLRSR
jgi:transposase-like protein